jgi:peroxiredoxin (alkyl hydroperoxide reductase subunit C)
MSLVGTKEPEWTAIAYYRGEKKKLSSADFRGKWHVLYWYPEDFTFICPTEIVGFQRLLGAFEDERVAVVGVSTDSFHSHRAWFADRQTFPEEISHPVLADPSHAVSKAFDVLKEDEGIAYRATVIVDDRGIIRALSVNDTSAGRSPREILRTVQALQSGGLCAVDWHKGDTFVG